jgi:hypothetical protein
MRLRLKGGEPTTNKPLVINTEGNPKLSNSPSVSESPPKVQIANVPTEIKSSNNNSNPTTNNPGTNKTDNRLGLPSVDDQKFSINRVEDLIKAANEERNRAQLSTDENAVDRIKKLDEKLEILKKIKNEYYQKSALGQLGKTTTQSDIKCNNLDSNLGTKNAKISRIEGSTINANNNSLYYIIDYIFNLLKRDLLNNSKAFEMYYSSSLNKVALLKSIVTKYIDDSVLNENQIKNIALNLNSKYIENKTDRFNDFYCLFNFEDFLVDFQNGLYKLYNAKDYNDLYKIIINKWFGGKVPDQFIDITGNFNLLKLTRTLFEQLIMKIGNNTFNNIIESLFKNNYITSLYYSNYIYKRYISYLLLSDSEYVANKIDLQAIGEFFNIQFIELSENSINCIPTSNEIGENNERDLIFFLYKNSNNYYENIKITIGDENIVLRKKSSLQKIDSKDSSGKISTSSINVDNICKKSTIKF